MPHMRGIFAELEIPAGFPSLQGIFQISKKFADNWMS